MFDLDRWEEIWQTINRNRKRSIMTAFGIFWGILMLTIMLGAGLSLKKVFFAQFGDMSINSCYFWGGQTSIPYKGLPSGRWWQFENEDLDAIKNQVPGVKSVAATIWGSSYQFSRNDRKGEYSLMGSNPGFIGISPQTFKFGRFINEIDMEQRRKVCIITEQIWRELFPGGADPVGSTIRMGNMYLTVVGVISIAPTGMDFIGDKSVIIPLSTMQQMYRMGNKVSNVVVAAYGDIDIGQVEEEVKQVIRERHTISPLDSRATYSWNMGGMVKKITNLFNGISILSWIVGIGTLLSGIVGISNIMLVVVRERTQEIGVRRALGAKPGAIITQIMSESFVLTFVAGIGGLTLAVGILSVAESVLSATAGKLIEVQMPFGLGMSALGILIAGSLIAGILPANRALRIKPVDAIREE